MTVRKGDVVRIRYEGRLADGELFECCGEDSPLQFTVGAGEVIEGLESAVEGMELNQEKDVRVDPSFAYGHWTAELVKDIPRINLPTNVPIIAGKRITLKTKTGRSITPMVEAESDEYVRMDFNHPLAGKELLLKFKVTGIN